MGRRVITSSAQSNKTGESIDSFAAKVVKYIPADVVAAWITVNSLIKPASTNATTDQTDYPVLFGVFFVFVVITALWTWRTTKEPDMPVAKTQILISIVSFVVWVLAIGGPFQYFQAVSARPYLGGIVLIIWTLVAGLIAPTESEGKVQPAT
jgi:hypothetical protein